MVGKTISHYRVLRSIGCGGMGEVYEAEDLDLGRHVALKFLSVSHPATDETRQRFEREARTASALNHPHICTVFEFGNHEGQRFIAMELLQGATLRDRIKQHQLSVEQCLDLGIEVADALEAAHRASVVHRDVTPSNIFVTAEGHAKVLDFGLAKMHRGAAPALAEIANEASTRTAPLATLTTPGTTMGTVAYMSPEQIAGGDVDARTDMFSFGCVLYEMATGVRPFSGKTTALIFDSILHEEPVPASLRNPAVPAGLQQIIGKALEKDRELRYQNAGELRRDLERVRRDSHQPVGRRRAYPPRPTMRFLLAGLLLAIAATVYLIVDGTTGAMPTSAQVTSSPGLETDPAISPDGTTIAYTARGREADEDIWMVDVSGGPPRRVTTNPANDRYPAWFPDGATFAFVSDRDGRAGVWRAPRLDGEAATLLVPDADHPAISPDGREISFVRGRGGYKRVAIAPIDDPARVRFISDDAAGKWDHSRPVWSPDGRTICYDAWDGLWLVPVSGAPARRLTTTDARNDSEPWWSPGGRFVYFTSLRERQTTLWRIPREGGRPERVTVAAGTERTPRLSRDGRLIAFSTALGTHDLVLRDLASGQETPFGHSREEMFPVFAPDGRRVYFISDRWGAFDIWSQEIADGKAVGDARRLAETEGVESHLACSPDGRWLAYYRILDGHRDVFVIGTGGGPATRITDGAADAFEPSWSPDGSQLAFSSERDGTRQIWAQRVSEGKPVGAPRRVTSGRAVHDGPAWSLDGSQIAFLITTAPGGAEVGVVAADGETPSRVLAHGADVRHLTWHHAFGLLAAGTWGHSAIEVRAVPLGLSALSQPSFSLLLGTDTAAALFDVSRDGRFAVYPRGVLEGDIWVLRAGSSPF